MELVLGAKPAEVEHQVPADRLTAMFLTLEIVTTHHQAVVVEDRMVEELRALMVWLPEVQTETVEK